MRSFCRKNNVHKIPRFRGGVFWVFFGGGSADFILYGREDFLKKVHFKVRKMPFWRPPRAIFWGTCKYSRIFGLYRIAIGRTPKGAYSTRGRSRHLLETAFSEPLLRTLLRTLFYCKTHRRPPSQNPSENPFPRTLPRTFSEPFSERCVVVRPLRRAPYANPRDTVVWTLRNRWPEGLAGDTPSDTRTPLLFGATPWDTWALRLQNIPKGPRIEKNSRSPSEIEIFRGDFRHSLRGSLLEGGLQQ